MLFTVGRMNPPTIGHMELVKIMMEQNYALPPEDLGRGKVYAILSVKQDAENPLNCATKRIYLEQKGMLQKIKSANPHLAFIEVKNICMDEVATENCEKMYKFNPDPEIKIKPNPILNQLCNIIETEPGITHAQLIVGEDRQKEFNWIESFFTKKNIKFNEDKEKTDYINSLLRRPSLSAEEKMRYIMDDSLEIPLEHMSATIMRGLVREGKLEKFKKLVQQSGIAPSDAEELYYEIDYNLKNSPQKAATASKVKAASKAKTATKSKGGKKNKKKQTTLKNKKKRTTLKKKKNVKQRYTRK